jgi:hypothetical protein
MPEYSKLVGAAIDGAKKTADAWTRENDTVYFESVPEPSSLAVPDPVSLAKPAPYAEPTPTTPTLHFQQQACSVM